jgi:large subunit ribosomal protein L25
VENLNLVANKRQILGKKVKDLRLRGELPANIYGKGLTSTATTVNERSFREIHRQAGETGIVYVNVAGEEKPRPVLIHAVQKDPVTGYPQHVDFYQVNLKERTTAPVPITMTGENVLERGGEGLIIQTLNEIEVEALPTDIPREFQVDISQLIEIGQTVKVGDLHYDREKVAIKVDPEEVILVLQTAEMKEEVVEEVAATEEPVVLSEEEAAARAAAEASGGEVTEEAAPAPAPEKS